MKSLLFFGSIVLAAGACYGLYKLFDELSCEENEDDFDDNKDIIKAPYDEESYGAAVTKEWIINKSRELFNNTKAKKISIMDLNNINSLKYKLNKYINEGFDYAIVLMDEYDKIFRIEVVKNLLSTDEEVNQLLGEEHMLVINA
ncbi:MAG: hypothetical protein J6A58_10625 [Oscillospiraceae bacterium]|nr:hypothetical protein [Oscillospiraceae bacterium]